MTGALSAVLACLAWAFVVFAAYRIGFTCGHARGFDAGRKRGTRRGFNAALLVHRARKGDASAMAALSSLRLSETAADAELLAGVHEYARQIGDA